MNRPGPIFFFGPYPLTKGLTLGMPISIRHATRHPGADLTCGSSQVQGNSLPKFDLLPNFNHPPRTTPVTVNIPRIRVQKHYKTKAVIEKHALGCIISRRSNFLGESISLLPMTGYRLVGNRRGCRENCLRKNVPPPLTRGQTDLPRMGLGPYQWYG